MQDYECVNPECSEHGKKEARWSARDRDPVPCYVCKQPVKLCEEQFKCERSNPQVVLKTGRLPKGTPTGLGQSIKDLEKAQRSLNGTGEI